MEIVNMARIVSIPNLDHLVRRYLSGESLKHLADDSGINRQVLTERMRKAGVQLRGRADAERLKWSGMDGDRRARQVAAAHTARKGRVDPPERKMLRAHTRAAKGLHIGFGETPLADALRARGQSVTQQHPVDGYNLDLSLDGLLVAVEVQGAVNGRGSARLTQRTKHLLDRGWLVVFVLLHRTWAFRVEEVADQVLALAERARRGEPLGGHYAVLRGDGQGATGCRAYLDDLPRVPAPHDGDDLA